MIDHWYAIKHKLGDRWYGPSLITIRNDAVYWRGGPSYMTVHDWDKVQIIKDYGEIDDMDRGNIENLYDQFDLDFPPIAETKVSAGWLAPNGKFYPCQYMEHLSEARHLAFVHYKERGNGEQRIEKEGWAKIYSDGTCLLPTSYLYDQDGEYTQAQLDTLSDLLVLAIKEGAEGYAKHLKKEFANVA